MKVLFVASLLSHIGQFHMPFIRFLKENGYTVEAACFNNSTDKPGLDFEGIDKIYNVDFVRSPYSLKNFQAYKQLKEIIKEGNYDIVHCHTPMASILTRLACRKYRKSGLKVIYTVHGFHFFKGAPIKNWMFYYPAEKFFARYCDALITLNSEDYAFAKNKFNNKNVYKVNGVGLNLEKYNLAKSKDILKPLGIPDNAYVILSVGELNKNKNYKVVIDAVNMLNNKSIYYLIAGVGPLKDYLQSYINRGQSNVKLLGYRRDIDLLLNACDLYIQPSLREGLPLSLMEAIASKTDVIASDIRGCRDLVDSQSLFDPKDSKAISVLIKKKMHLHSDKDIISNYSKIQDCSISNVNSNLLSIYKNLNNNY